MTEGADIFDNDGSNTGTARWVTLAEAAAAVGLSSETIRRAAKGGTIRGQRAGDSQNAMWLVHLEDVEARWGDKGSVPQAEVDDPDRGLNSDDMLGATREGMAAPPRTQEDDSSKTPDFQTETTEPNLDVVEPIHPERAQTPMVTSCEIRRTGRVWAKLLSTDLKLIVEGQESARIRTSFRRTDRNDVAFREAVALRQTRVVFANSPPWLIRAVEPGPRGGKTMIFGNTREMLHPIISRVITVFENDQPIASSDGPIPTMPLKGSGKGSCVAVAVGKRFTLSPPWRADRGTIDKQATLLSYGFWDTTWSVKAREPVPLSVVLLYWHVLLGDWQDPGQDGAGAASGG